MEEMKMVPAATLQYGICGRLPQKEKMYGSVAFICSEPSAVAVTQQGRRNYLLPLKVKAALVSDS